VDVEERTLSLDEILSYIKQDSAIIILLDWNIITGGEGYQGHFVPVVGFDSKYIYVHNHGFLNPTPFLPISRELFEKARKSRGTDEDIVIIFKL